MIARLASSLIIFDCFLLPIRADLFGNSICQSVLFLLVPCLRNHRFAFFEKPATQFILM